MPKSGYSTIRTPYIDQLRSISISTQQPISKIIEQALDLYFNHNHTITYKAYWLNSGKIIYTNKPSGELYSSLPSGAWPIELGNDLKDPYDGAKFIIKGVDDFIIIDKEKKGEKGE